MLIVASWMVCRPWRVVGCYGVKEASMRWVWRYPGVAIRVMSSLVTLTWRSSAREGMCLIRRMCVTISVNVFEPMCTIILYEPMIYPSMHEWFAKALFPKWVIDFEIFADVELDWYMWSIKVPFLLQLCFTQVILNGLSEKRHILLKVQPPRCGIAMVWLDFDSMWIGWETRILAIKRPQWTHPGGSMHRGVVCVHCERQYLIPSLV